MNDIVIENLNKSFGNKKVLENFNCTFPANTISCIMAPSGYGKTTLLRIIMGLEKADSGKISGTDNCRISVVFQEDRLCENLTAQANIRLVNKKLNKQSVVNAMREVGLTTQFDQLVREFSGGMKRRIAVLRALMAEYEILILDEPFKGLDEQTKKQMIEYTLNHCKDKTVLFVTHDPAEIKAMSARLFKMDELNKI